MKILTPSQANNEDILSGVIAELNGTFTVFTSTKHTTYKTEKAANKKWASLVEADLV